MVPSSSLEDPKMASSSEYEAVTKKHLMIW